MALAKSKRCFFGLNLDGRLPLLASTISLKKGSDGVATTTSTGRPKGLQVLFELEVPVKKPAPLTVKFNQNIQSLLRTKSPPVMDPKHQPFDLQPFNMRPT